MANELAKKTTSNSETKINSVVAEKVFRNNSNVCRCYRRHTIFWFFLNNIKTASDDISDLSQILLPALVIVAGSY